jgi:hypothetical protein
MNLGWINDNKSEDDLRSVILHEFGHALGAVHEHESPYARIQWDREKVYEDLGGPPPQQLGQGQSGRKYVHSLHA